MMQLLPGLTRYLYVGFINISGIFGIQRVSHLTLKWFYIGAPLSG